MNETDNILWKKSENGVKVLRVFSDSLIIKLPDFIEGLPVTEIGPYCFSASEPRNLGEYNETNGNTHRATPCACGMDLKSVVLPEKITTIHNAAFYHCWCLKEISFGCKVRSIGSDVFMNCNALENIVIKGRPQDESGLSYIIERIEKGIEVCFIPEYRVEGRLYFPEYYEWLDEISPAHIFSRSINGEGFRMRKCIRNQKVDYEKYDGCFENAVATESEEDLCHIAMNRLMWPVELKKEFAVKYKSYVTEHTSVILRKMIEKKDIGGIEFLNSHDFLQENILLEGMKWCLEKEWIEGNTFLMEILYETRKKKPKKFTF